MVERDPYVTLLELFRAEISKHAAPSFVIGTVMSVQPLKVTCSGMLLGEEDLVISEQIRSDNKLKVGSKIILLAGDEQQTFATIGKVAGT